MWFCTYCIINISSNKHLSSHTANKFCFPGPRDIARAMELFELEGTLLSRREVADLLPRINFYYDWLLNSPKIRDHQYKLKWKFGSAGSFPGHFKGPHAVAVDKDSNILVIECIMNRLQVFTPAGTYLKSIDLKFRNPLGLAVDDLGNILVSEVGSHTVQVLDPSGKPSFEIGSKGKAQGQFNTPLDVTTDRDCNIFVVDAMNSRIQVFDQKGTFKFQFGPDEFSPNAIAVNHHGIFVAEQYKNTIQVFSLTGQFIRKFGELGALPGELSAPVGIAVDRDGFLAISEEQNNRIQVMDMYGKSVMVVGEAGARPGYLNRPHKLVLSGGDILIADVLNNRIQCFG